MYLLIESSGTEEDNKVVDFIRDMAEDEFGFTVETVTGDTNSNVVLYKEINGHPSELIRFTAMPDEELLRFYLENYFNEDDD